MQALTVRLYGFLGEKYGKEHKLYVSSPAEAVRALCANYKEFKKDIIRDGKQYYRIFTGKENKATEELIKLKTSKDIKIVPVVAGAGGLGRILVGAALIVASFYLPTTALIGTTSLSGIASGLGFSLLLGGISSLLFSPPKPERYQNEAPENRPSYTFSGAINVTGQGNPIPIAYGGPIGVGSQVISVGLSVAQI
jgi:predicted phage tail protein